MRAFTFALTLSLLIPTTANSDDEDLLRSMEIEIAIREASKDAMKQSRDRAREAIKKTSIYAKHETLFSQATDQLKAYKSISDTNRMNFSSAKRLELELRELVSRGYPEVRSPRYPTDYFRCSATYDYYDPKLKSCRNLEDDITSTTAGYSLCVSDPSYLKSLPSGGNCEAVKIKIEHRYKKLKEYVDKEAAAKKEEDIAYQSYLQLSDARSAVYDEMKEIMDTFTWKLFRTEMIERLKALELEITNSAMDKIKSEFDSIQLRT